MKKICYLFVLAIMPMCFIACGGDDDGPTGQDALIIGSWERIKYESYNTKGEKEYETRESRIDTYYVDGTCQHGTKDRKFQWKIDGSKLIITDNGSSEVYIIQTLDKSDMILHFDYSDGRYFIEKYRKITGNQ